MRQVCVIVGVVFFSVQTGEVARIAALQKHGQVCEAHRVVLNFVLSRAGSHEAATNSI